MEKMFNINVFWVLFLVLSHTIGNQGYSENGLIRFGDDKDKFPQYIVSIRNHENCHICTGSIISENWVLTSYLCRDASHVLYGKSEFENCNEIQEDQYKNTITETQFSEGISVLLYKVQNNFDLIKLGLSTPSRCCLVCNKGTAIGWSLENGEKDCVMKKIDGVNLKKAFSENSTSFDGIGCGSPLLVKHKVVGIFSNLGGCFTDISDDLVWIKETMKEKIQDNPSIN